MFCTEDPPAGEHIEQRWQELIGLAVLAEESGYGLVGLPEHHMLDSGHLAAPLVALGAFAARTSSVRLATIATVATFWDPIRLAEEAAMVDILSGGRLTLGVALGNYEPENRLFGVPPGRQVSRFVETVEILKMAARGDPVSSAGEHYTYDNVKVTPRPVQRPVPIWVGAMSMNGARRAARLGLPLILDCANRIERVRPWIQAYRQTCAEHGTRAYVVLPRYAWLEAEPGDAERIFWPHLKLSLLRYLHTIPRIQDPTLTAADGDELGFDLAKRDRLLAGDAGEIIETVRGWRESLGIDAIIVRFQGPTGPWGQDLARSLSAFGRQVIPADPLAMEPARHA
jgi:alkanesulfonate monooxygenase SsuD/methylene tetrahydromethanopterin reductase-like flavin-dependent oxidoreductase (luciferase family)